MNKKIVSICIVGILMLTGCSADLGNNAMGMPEATESSGTVSDGMVIHVACEDEEGNPVKGAVVQICSGTLCQTIESDVDGRVEYSGKEGIYTVEGLKAPAGYEIATKDIFTISSTGENVKLVFRADGSGTVESEETVSQKSNGTISGEYPKLEFSTVDYLGNPVDDSILQEANVTMINFWEDWCGWCLKEMPGMQETFEKYRDDGLQIIGVYTADYSGAMTPSDYDNVKKILDEYGITYTIVEYCDSFAAYDKQVRPVSFFVDSEGNVLTVEDEDVCLKYAYASIDDAIERYEAEAESVTDAQEKASYDNVIQDIHSNYDMYAAQFIDEIKGTGVIEGYIPEKALDALLRYLLNLE